MLYYTTGNFIRKVIRYHKGGGSSSPKLPPPPDPVAPPREDEGAKKRALERFRRETRRKRGYTSTVLTGGLGVAGAESQKTVLGG